MDDVNILTTTSPFYSKRMNSVYFTEQYVCSYSSFLDLQKHIFLNSYFTDGSQTAFIYNHMYFYVNDQQSSILYVNYKAKDIREKEVKDAICNTLNKNGKVLISEYPIGRAQELLCIIEQVLEEHHFDVFPFCSEPCLGSYLLQFILGTEFVALLSYLFKMDQSKESEQEHSHVSSPSKDEPQPPHTSM